jgi:hypothetical protein
MLKRLTILSLLASIVLAWPADAAPKLYSIGAGSVRGKPEIEEGKVTGIFIWFDREGLHMRWTTSGKPVLFSGRLDLDKPLGELKRVRDDAGGWARAHGKRVVLFSCTSRGELDGIDLTIPAGRRVRMELQIDGTDATPEEVYFGAKGVHPKGFPLSVTFR